MQPARLFRNGVEVVSRPAPEPVLGDCPGCAILRERRRKTSRAARHWYGVARALRRQLHALEVRFGIAADATPDAQIAGLVETVNRLRERLAQQESRFARANERNYHLTKDTELLQKRLAHAERQIARLKRLEGAPS